MPLPPYHPQATSKADIGALIFLSLSFCLFLNFLEFPPAHCLPSFLPLFTTTLVANLFHLLLTFSRMDADHHQVPVRAAAENCGVLQTASRARLWFTLWTNAPGGGTGFKAVGLQWETCYVHVPGEELERAAEWLRSSGGLEEVYAKWFIFAEYSLSVNRLLGLDIVLSLVVEQG